MNDASSARALLLVALAACGAPDPSFNVPRGGPTAPTDASDAGPAVPASPAGSATPDAAFDDEAVLGVIAGQEYETSSSFLRVSVPYPSLAAPGSLVTEWISAGAAAAYASIRPDGGSTGAVVPVGTVIVRDVLNDAGAVRKVTLMAKGPPGYNPAIGDWWFGVTDPSGVPVGDGDGGVMLGKLGGCYSCHLLHGGNDFLFGVPADAQANAP